MELPDVFEFKGFVVAVDERLQTVTIVGRVCVRRKWRDVVAEFREVSFDDFAVAGPLTVRWCAASLNYLSVGPREDPWWWLRVNKSHEDMCESYGRVGDVEHSLALQALDIAGCYDWLDTVASGSVGLVSKRAQLVESFGSGRGPAPPSHESVDEEDEKVAGVMKQTRKTREERSLLAAQ